MKRTKSRQNLANSRQIWHRTGRARQYGGERHDELGVVKATLLDLKEKQRKTKWKQGKEKKKTEDEDRRRGERIHPSYPEALAGGSGESHKEEESLERGEHFSL